MTTDRRGMTLVELLVALSLTGLALSMAVGMSFVGAAHGERLELRVTEHESAALGERLLTRLLLSAVAPSNDSTRVEGFDHAVKFEGECPSATAVSVPCRVSLVLSESTDGHSELVASWGEGSRASLLTLPSEARFAFLSYEEGVARWHPEWGASLRAPRAVGLVTRSDTMLFRFGAP